METSQIERRSLNAQAAGGNRGNIPCGCTIRIGCIPFQNQASLFFIGLCSLVGLGDLDICCIFLSLSLDLTLCDPYEVSILCKRAFSVSFDLLDCCAAASILLNRDVFFFFTPAPSRFPSIMMQVLVPWSSVELPALMNAVLLDTLRSPGGLHGMGLASLLVKPPGRTI